MTSADRGTGTESRSPSARSVLTNGTVRTMSDPNTVASAVGVIDGQVVAVGSFDDVIAAVGPNATLVDLDGGTLLPGFVDPHVHIEDRDAFYGVLDETANEAELADRFAPIRSAHRPGEWISTDSVIAGDWLDRTVLDRMAPENPTLLVVGAAWNVLNSAALKALDVDRALAAGGRIGRDPATGEPTGRVKTIGSGQIKGLMPTAPLYTVDTVIASVQRGLARLLAAGVTTTHHMIRDPIPLEAYRRLVVADKLRMRVGLIPRVYEAEFTLADVLDLEDTLPGDRLTFQGVKISLDGYYGDLSSRQTVSYDGDPDNFGRWRIDAETLDAIVLESHRRGLRMSLHANGAAAVDRALDAFENALHTVPRADHRHRLEHFGNIVVTDEQLARVKRLGVVVVPNPPVWHAETARLRAHLASNPAFRPMSLRRMLDDGLLVGLACDNVEPIDPIASVGALATRRLEDGSLDQPDQAVTPWESLRLYTVANAWLGRHERAGTIRVGADADFAWIDADPLAVPVDALAAIGVRGTMVAGQWEYTRGGDG